MSKIAVEKKRTVALVGHNGSGKSLLLSSMLATAGVTDRVNLRLIDSDPLEEARGASLSSHVFSFKWGDHQISVVDTPGFGDFVAEVLNAIFVTENIVSVVNATAGVEIQTERTWNMAENMMKPRMVFVNQLDKDRANFDSTLEGTES